MYQLRRAAKGQPKAGEHAPFRAQYVQLARGRFIAIASDNPWKLIRPMKTNHIARFEEILQHLRVCEEVDRGGAAGRMPARARQDDAIRLSPSRFNDQATFDRIHEILRSLVAMRST